MGKNNLRINKLRTMIFQYTLFINMLLFRASKFIFYVFTNYRKFQKHISNVNWFDWISPMGQCNGTLYISFGAVLMTR